MDLMKEGAWINVATGDYRWIDEHAQWLHRPGNAASLGLENNVIEELGRVPWDTSKLLDDIVLEAQAGGISGTM